MENEQEKENVELLPPIPVSPTTLIDLPIEQSSSSLLIDNPISPINNIIVHPVTYNLNFYKEKNVGDIEIPEIDTPLIALLPNGKTTVGSSQQTSVVKIEVRRDVWDTAGFTSPLNSAKIDLCSLENYLTTHETLSICCARHEIPSKCNVYPFFSRSVPYFGNLVNLQMQNIFIIKSFVDAISTIPLQQLSLSGCIVDRCQLLLTRNIRTIQLDCTKHGNGMLHFKIPYGCRIDLLEIFCRWIKASRYTAISSIYVLEFDAIPKDSISKCTSCEKIVLDLTPDDYPQILSFLYFVHNILCSKIVLMSNFTPLAYPKAEHIDSFYNTRYLKSLDDPLTSLRLLRTRKRDNKTPPPIWIDIFKIFRQIGVEQLAMDAKTAILVFCIMEITMDQVGLPIVMVEYSYATPPFTTYDPKIYEYFFLNKPCPDRQFKHYKLSSLQSGESCPVIDIPVEFDMLRTCQVFMRLTNGCGFLAHDPIMAFALRDSTLCDPNTPWMYKIKNFFRVT